MLKFFYKNSSLLFKQQIKQQRLQTMKNHLIENIKFFRVYNSISKSLLIRKYSKKFMII